MSRELLITRNTSGQLTRGTIAIIEDGDMRSILTLCLNDAGFDVYQFYNTSEFQAATANRLPAFHFIILDNDTGVCPESKEPHPKGIAISNELSEKYPRSKIILYTGNPNIIPEGKDKSEFGIDIIVGKAERGISDVGALSRVIEEEMASYKKPAASDGPSHGGWCAGFKRNTSSIPEPSSFEGSGRW